MHERKKNSRAKWSGGEYAVGKAEAVGNGVLDLHIGIILHSLKDCVYMTDGIKYKLADMVFRGLCSTNEVDWIIHDYQQIVLEEPNFSQTCSRSWGGLHGTQQCSKQLQML
jgi:hypothetical protein